MREGLSKGESDVIVEKKSSAVIERPRELPVLSLPPCSILTTDRRSTLGRKKKGHRYAPSYVLWPPDADFSPEEVKRTRRPFSDSAALVGWIRRGTATGNG